MATQAISFAVNRVKAVLQRRPEVGLHDDPLATARWQGGFRVESSGPNDTVILTDMPSELGGSGDQVTPGWLFRASLASCLASSIALRAVSEGIELEVLEVQASSRSDARGLFGMADTGGNQVSAEPFDVQLRVRIVAAGVAPDRLRSLVEQSEQCSPIPSAVRHAVPLTVTVDLDPS
jgi:uncharacterized OsmC-like protein